jgi:hypothetical protein
MTTKTVAELEQQIAEVKAAEAKAQQESAREMEQRDLAYRRQRLAEYDRPTLRQVSAQAERAFMAALNDSPLITAFLATQATRWREYRLGQLAHNDRVALSLADGKEPPHDAGASAPHLTAANFINALERAIGQAIEAASAELDEAHSLGVLGTADPAVAAAAGEAAETERRRQAALHVASGSIDVTGMSDPEREALGLPPGSSRTKSR